MHIAISNFKMNRLFPSAILISLLLLVSGVFVNVAGQAQTTASSDFSYFVNPLYVAASPSTVVPNDVPFCLATNKNVPTYPIIYCYSPNFIQTAYNFTGAYKLVGGYTYAGKDQTIVIVDAYGSPTIKSDLKYFDKVFGIPDPPSFQIVCSPPGCPSFNPLNFPFDELGWTIETTLDVEYAHAMAPGANIVLVVASTPAGDAINTAEAMAIAKFPGSVMSQSFGIPEYLITGNNAQILQAEKNYAAAAAANITVLASAGDEGAGNGINQPNALFPASSPYVTAVGGTEGYSFGKLVTYTGTCSPGPGPGYPTGCTPTGYGSEAVWNEAWLPAAGGGAPSLIFAAPIWQSGITGYKMRTTPDISFNAAVDGGVLVYWSACLTCISQSFTGWFVIGGTSAGSPQWAAIFAIANQLRSMNNKGPLGFVNPTLYSLAESGRYSYDFHDIIVGNNTLAGTTAGFYAKTGYDLASGWGTPNVGNLVQDLASSS
jgi:subtilase family serine protease